MGELYLVCGAGGHGRVVADLVYVSGCTLAGFVDRDVAMLGQEVAAEGARVVVLESELLRHIRKGGALPEGATALALGIGDNQARRALRLAVRATPCPPLMHPGAIVSSIQEIDNDYIHLLEQLITLVNKLTAEQQQQYLAVCGEILNFDKDLSTSEQRKIARKLRPILEDHQIDEPYELSKDLAMVGISENNIELLVPLLETPETEKVSQSLYQLGMTRIRVRDIKICIGRITELVKALKSYARLDNKTLAYTNLQQDLNDTLIILNNKLKRAITVHKEFDSVEQVYCYADQLNQVWTNLIHNAIQAMRGEGDIYLRLKKWSEDEVAIEVEDTGPGIPDEVLPNIFEHYFTTKSKGEGTGLGLSISKEIVERHKGRLEVESIPGKTCFRTILPLSIEE